MLSEPPRCRPVPVRALKGADSPRGLHRRHSPGHGSPPGARSTGGGWSLPASWPDPNSLRQLNPDHDETYKGAQKRGKQRALTSSRLGCKAARLVLTLAPCHDRERNIRQRALQLQRCLGRAVSQVSISSGVVRITGMALGWIGATTAFASHVRKLNRRCSNSPSAFL